MRKPRVPVGTIVVATIGLAIALGLRPISVREILAAYVLALTAIALLVLTRMARTEEEWERATSELERALPPRKTARARPAELVRTERDLTLSSTNAGDLHTRLLPQLREVAAARLAARHDADLADARDVIGDVAWEYLRADRPAPDDRTAHGLPLRRIAALVDAIERL
ncbi:MAG TPA: hypothetical protein VFW41_00425 [Gaiellaceae bacterium]|nr:hypothetical protein [Gaiellaceae bacterium]